MGGGAIHLDFETRSPTDLKRTGVYRYVEDPHTAIWLFAYRFRHGPILQWRPGQSAPDRLLEHIAAGGWVKAHNAAFERIVWNVVLRRTPGCERWPRLTIQQMDCSMARALAIHLPGDLDTLGAVLNIMHQKDKEGHALMMKLAKPRKPTKTCPLPLGADYLWWDAPENIDRLGLYCEGDVAAETDIDDRLPPLSVAEREIWELDQVINDRGIALDASSIERCVAVLEVAQQRANARMSELTSGEVTKCTEAARIVSWLQRRGLPADSIAKDEHKALLQWCDVLGDDLAADVIRLRATNGKSSTAKFDRMLEVKCADNRARGLLRYHRAPTGRWGGEFIQPHNLPRVDEDEELPDVLGALEIMGEVR